MSTNIIQFPQNRRCAQTATPPTEKGPTGARVVRINRFVDGQRGQAGRMVITGRMADVCAALDQMVAREGCA
jgi:hypothetical protein